MDDKQIVELYCNRNEIAIDATQKKYGAYCLRIANDILTSPEDAEECVNDAWVSAWNRIPPVIPTSLKAFLGKVIRDLALSKYRANHSQKRYAGIAVMLDELDDCIPSSFDVVEVTEAHHLTELINRWLEDLPKEDRVLFVKRYYYGRPVKALSKEFHCTDNQMAQRMMKLRNKLKAFLEKEGVTL